MKRKSILITPDCAMISDTLVVTPWSSGVSWNSLEESVHQQENTALLPSPSSTLHKYRTIERECEGKTYVGCSGSHVPLSYISFLLRVGRPSPLVFPIFRCKRSYWLTLSTLNIIRSVKYVYHRTTLTVMLAGLFSYIFSLQFQV